MKLSDTQKRILRAAQLKASAPASELAKLSGCREHVVRHALSTLIDAGVIYPSIMVNLAPLGFSRYNLLFSTGSGSSISRRKILQDLVKMPQVIFLAEIGGDWEYELSFAVRSPGDLERFLDRLSDLLKDNFVKKSLVQTLEKHVFGSKYLAPSLKIPPLSSTSSVARVAIDELDHRLLFEVVHGKGMSLHELGRKLKQPVSTLSYRISSLEKRGIIIGWYFIQNASPYGMLRFKIVMHMRGMHSSTSARLYAFCAQHPNVDVLLCCVGAHDYEMVVQATCYEDVVALADELREQFRDAINQLTIVPTFKVHRFSDYPFPDFALVQP